MHGRQSWVFGGKWPTPLTRPLPFCPPPEQQFPGPQVSTWLSPAPLPPLITPGPSLAPALTLSLKSPELAADPRGLRGGGLPSRPGPGVTPEASTRGLRTQGLEAGGPGRGGRVGDPAAGAPLGVRAHRLPARRHRPAGHAQEAQGHEARREEEHRLARPPRTRTHTHTEKESSVAQERRRVKLGPPRVGQTRGCPGWSLPLGGGGGQRLDQRDLEGGDGAQVSPAPLVKAGRFLLPSPALGERRSLPTQGKGKEPVGAGDPQLGKDEPGHPPRGTQKKRTQRASVG